MLHLSTISIMAGQKENLPQGKGVRSKKYPELSYGQIKTCFLDACRLKCRSRSPNSIYFLAGKSRKNCWNHSRNEFLYTSFDYFLHLHSYSDTGDNVQHIKPSVIEKSSTYLLLRKDISEACFLQHLYKSYN